MESLQVIYLVVVQAELDLLEIQEPLLQTVVEVKELQVIQLQLELHAEQLTVNQV